LATPNYGYEKRQKELAKKKKKEEKLKSKSEKKTHLDGTEVGLNDTPDNGQAPASESV
jgi:hypothetical protein